VGLVEKTTGKGAFPSDYARISKLIVLRPTCTGVAFSQVVAAIQTDRADAGRTMDAQRIEELPSGETFHYPQFVNRTSSLPAQFDKRGGGV
jgi:hypothetical protein